MIQKSKKNLLLQITQNGPIRENKCMVSSIVSGPPLKWPKFRFSPFIFTNWTILSDLKHNLFFRKFSTDGRFWPVQAHGEKNLNRFQIFPGPKIFRGGSSHYYLPFLRVLAKSLA